VDVSPLMTHEVSIADAVAGFELAADRTSGSSKVMIRLG
jgi:L-idonate 5-dehydrogenase